MKKKRKALLEKLKCEVNWLGDEKMTELFLDELEKDFDLKSGMTIVEYITKQNEDYEKDRKKTFEVFREYLFNGLNNQQIKLFSFIENYYKEETKRLTDKNDLLKFEIQEREACLEGWSYSQHEDEKGEMHFAPAYNPYADYFITELNKFRNKKIPLNRRQGYVDIFINVVMNEKSESKALEDYNKKIKTNEDKFKRSALSEFKKTKRYVPLIRAIEAQKSNAELLLILSE